jgi:16S rRNA (uracil1498-N3)-methyltransferase
MRQFILPESFAGDCSVKLTGESFHYICNVLRKKNGDSFPGLDKKGKGWQLTISEINNEFCMLEVIPMESEKSGKVEITLVQCLPKGKKMDLIIRQAVESGVKRIIPVLSDHSVPRFDNDKDIEKKRQRWEKIAIEAMQQSGSSIIPEIHKPVKMDKVPLLWDQCGPGLFCHQEKIDENNLHKCLNENFNQVYIVIGPEGGISDREVKLLQEAGFQPIYLGDNVLRTETAALYTTAAVNVILLEKNTWNLNLPAAAE